MLADFDACMRPSELKFDKLQLWARVPNLPFNMQNDRWGKEVAKQIDPNATSVHFDPVGGFLRARVMINVNKPLRRWILIDSKKRESRDWYDIQYEQVPNFCFSCGRLGHSDLHCPTPGSRDENGDLPFKTCLRAPEEKKKAVSSEGSSKEQQSSQNSNKEARTATAKRDDNPEVVSPPKKNKQRYKRKEGPQGQKQVYR